MTDEGQPRVVTGAEADAVRSNARAIGNGSLDLLLQGKVIHFTDTRVRFSRVRIRDRYGLRLRSKVDGNGGQYYWTEPLPAPESE